MKTIILDIIIGFLLALGLMVTFNPDSVYLMGLIHPESSARIMVEDLK